jgi:exonuclease III
MLYAYQLTESSCSLMTAPWSTDNHQREHIVPKMSRDMECVILDWNVSGLNNLARRQVLREVVQEQHCPIFCVQETKVQLMDDNFVSSCLGNQFLGGYATKPANGTCGGIILACSQVKYSISQVDIREYSVTTVIKSKTNNEEWSVTRVYDL